MQQALLFIAVASTAPAQYSGTIQAAQQTQGSVVIPDVLLPGPGSSNIRSGYGGLVGSDIHHPNGNIIDQVLMTGRYVTVAADPGQVVRVSFLDDNDDIVQVEASGPGNVTIELDAVSYRGPAAPSKYNQPGINYMKGHATVRVQGATADTFINIFSVGRGNAVNPSLFPAGMTYDAMADVQLLQIEGSGMAAILTGNVRYTGKTGPVGVLAPAVSVRYRAIVGEIEAREQAVPVLRLDTISPLAWDGGAVLVAGGDLYQANGMPVDITSQSGVALGRIDAVNGTLSSGAILPASGFSAEFASKQPGSVAANGTVCPTRGYVPASFDALRAEVGFDTFDFGDGTSIGFSGGNTGTYVLTLDTVIEGEQVHGRLTGGYSYVVSGANQNQMTFSMTLDRLTLTSASVSFSGSIPDLARMSGTILPVRYTATAEYASSLKGTATLTVVYSSGYQESSTFAFDQEHGLDFGLF